MKTASVRKRHIVLWVIGGIILFVAGFFVYQDLQYKQLAAADKQRFESALTDMNKFFDALGTTVTNRTVERTCDYGVGPWGDQGDLNCTVRVVGVMQSGLDSQLINGADNAKRVLMWENGQSSVQQGVRSDGTLYWYGGDFAGLDCYGNISNQQKIDYSCRDRTQFQHYQRVDR